MRKREDVAWGYFLDPLIEGKPGMIFTHETYVLAEEWRKIVAENNLNPGHIFRITPPKPKRRGSK